MLFRTQLKLSGNTGTVHIERFEISAGKGKATANVCKVHLNRFTKHSIAHKLRWLSTSSELISSEPVNVEPSIQSRPSILAPERITSPNVPLFKERWSSTSSKFISRLSMTRQLLMFMELILASNRFNFPVIVEPSNDINELAFIPSKSR